MPLPSEHTAAVRAALPLVALAERGDHEAFALALSAAVADPEDAGRVVYGLVELVRFTLGLGAVPRGQVRLDILNGMLIDLAATPDPDDG